MDKKNIIILAIALALILTTGIVVGSTYEPGSADDPLVSRSYVDSKIAQALADMPSSEGGVFTPVKVEAGKQLIGGEGTELILRSGNAKAVALGQDGLSDVTEAKDIKAGNSISKNHLLLIPRDDGRGIEASSEIWVMVKGSYKIK